MNSEKNFLNLNGEKISIGLFNDSFFPMADVVLSVVDNYARRLNEFANVTVFAPHGKKHNFDDILNDNELIQEKIIIPLLEWKESKLDLDMKDDIDDLIDLLKNKDELKKLELLI